VEEKELLNIPQENNECENCPNLRVDGHRHCSKPCNSGCFKLETYDWLKEISELDSFNEIIEVRFKNTRKGYFVNSNDLRLEKGDVVAVEASPGHDLGVVALTGQIVRFKMHSEGFAYKDQELKKVYRKAKLVDIEKWKEAIALEHKTMIRTRKIANDLALNMKIGDVEYQGDRTKAIFYYIADDRVDFRQLIKVLAEEFKIRIEMRQIGARQEAGRIGGIGSCGRELCCSSWITNFVSVTTNAARYQEVSLNPQKLAGQCGKLKCCLNYELDDYLDAQEDFPDTSVVLKTKNGKAFHQKTDVFKRLMWYSYVEEDKKSITCMTVDTIKEIIEMNSSGKFPEKLKGVEESSMASVIEYQNSVGSESLTRFEDKPSSSGKDNYRKGAKPFKKADNRNNHGDRRDNQNRPNQRNGQ
jgi:cell fate regulator YaaT (PSP1 superfamily)